MGCFSSFDLEEEVSASVEVVVVLHLVLLQLHVLLVVLGVVDPQSVVLQAKQLPSMIEIGMGIVPVVFLCDDLVSVGLFGI